MRTLLKNAWLLDNNYNMEPANVLIGGERIVSVSKEPLEAEQVIDLRGCTVIPGLVDTDLSCEDSAELDNRLRGYMNTAVTTARCDRMPPEILDGFPQTLYSCATVNSSMDLDHLYSKKLEIGGIKLGRKLVGAQNESEIRDICRRCAQGGLWVTAHAAGLAELQILTACGITELLNTPDFQISDTEIIRMVTKGICITLSTWDSAHITQVQQDNLRRFDSMGGMITLGSGRAKMPVSCDQIITLVESGLSLQNAVRSATFSGAVIVGTAQDEGTIMAGKYANLIVVLGNPREEPSALGRMRYIVRRGRVRQIS